MLIVTNLPNFPERWTLPSGVTGTARFAANYSEFRKHLAESSLLIVNGEPDLLLRLCRLFLTQPWLRRPLVSVDLVLRSPGPSPQSRLKALVKRLLLTQVGHFIHYFRDVSGYARDFGITAERSSFVPFKPNLRYRYELTPSADGEYVLCFGRSLRDYDTFFAAARMFPYPAAISTPDFEQLRIHGSRFTWKLSELPPNVAVIDDDGSQDAQVRLLERAHIVVLPILKSSVVSSGLSTYLNAMLMGKCVILSEGPGCSDVLTDQVVAVPPEDPSVLAEAITRVWTDDALRRRTAAAGYEYAAALGGEPELRERILRQSVQWLQSRL
jgi:glycosyltransferase involved in cell wall biosynthesis